LKTQVLGTPSREWRSGEIFGAVHLRGQVAEIGDLVNSGVHRVKTQVLGVQSREARGREAMKERGDRSHPSGEDRWREINGSRALGSSQVRVQHLVLQVARSRGSESRTAVGSVTQEDHWI
jgi:hypothetical protein